MMGIVNKIKTKTEKLCKEQPWIYPSSHSCEALSMLIFLCNFIIFSTYCNPTSLSYSCIYVSPLHIWNCHYVPIQRDYMTHIHQSIFYMSRWTLRASSNAPDMPVSSLIDMCRMIFNDTYSFFFGWKLFSTKQKEV